MIGYVTLFTFQNVVAKIHLKALRSELKYSSEGENKKPKRSVVSVGGKLSLKEIKEV